MVFKWIYLYGTLIENYTGLLSDPSEEGSSNALEKAHCEWNCNKSLKASFKNIYCYTEWAINSE